LVHSRVPALCQVNDAPKLWKTLGVQLTRRTHLELWDERLQDPGLFFNGGSVPQQERASVRVSNQALERIGRQWNGKWHCHGVQLRECGLENDPFRPVAGP